MSQPASWIAESGGQSLERNWLFDLRRERFRSRSTGKAHDFYVIHLADAVNVIALTIDRRMVLVRQFRAGSNADSLEPPGGLLNDGEDPLEAGARELLEETGYAGDRARVLGKSWSNPSILSSKIATILIENAVRVREPSLDDSEELDVVLMPESDVMHAIQNGEIDHALAVGGLLLWLHHERDKL